MKNKNGLSEKRTNCSEKQTNCAEKEHAFSKENTAMTEENREDFSIDMISLLLDSSLKIHDESNVLEAMRNIDQDERLLMKQAVFKMLKSLKPNAPSHLVERLPKLVDRLDAILFSHAGDPEEYLNEATLLFRITSLSKSVRKRKFDKT